MEFDELGFTLLSEPFAGFSCLFTCSSREGLLLHRRLLMAFPIVNRTSTEEGFQCLSKGCDVTGKDRITNIAVHVTTELNFTNNNPLICLWMQETYKPKLMGNFKQTINTHSTKTKVPLQTNTNRPQRRPVWSASDLTLVSIVRVCKTKNRSSLPFVW